VNSLSINVAAVATGGVVKMAIFSEDGQTRLISVSADVAAPGIQTYAVSAVTLPAGVYYVALVVANLVNVDISGYVTNAVGTVANLRGSVTGEPVIEGTITVASGVMPTTINPLTDIA